jgi:hypothetical protein
VLLEITAVTQYFQLLHLLVVAVGVTEYHLTMVGQHSAVQLAGLVVEAAVVTPELLAVVAQRLQVKGVLAAQDCHPHREVAVVVEQEALELVQDRGVPEASVYLHLFLERQLITLAAAAAVGMVLVEQEALVEAVAVVLVII